jgi:hypothetical protein
MVSVIAKNYVAVKTIVFVIQNNCFCSQNNEFALAEHLFFVMKAIAPVIKTRQTMALVSRQ